MYFYPDKYETTLSRNSLLVSFDFIQEMKHDGVLYYSLVSELSVGDVVFDIRFLKIEHLKHMPTIANSGYVLNAICFGGNKYHSFMFEDQTILTVNPALKYRLGDYILDEELLIQ